MKSDKGKAWAVSAEGQAKLVGTSLGAKAAGAGAKPDIRAKSAGTAAAAKGGGLVPEYAANFAWTTCAAMWTVVQAAARAGVAEAFLPRLAEMLALSIQAVQVTNPGHGLITQHKPCELDTLTMAAISACIKPGDQQAAFVTDGTPPFTYSDRYPSLFLALAKLRLEASGSADGPAAAALQQMIADQGATIARPHAERFKLGRGRNAVTPEWEDAYEARILPALLAGDARPFYSLWPRPAGVA